VEARESTVPSTSVVRFAAGDRDAFVEVYRAFAAPLRRWVARFFKSPFEQEEAVQEAWLTVHRMQKSYDVNKGTLGPWLRTVAANRCRELLRAKGRRPDASVPLDDMDEALWLVAPGPDDAALASKLRQAVETFAAGLEPEDAKVLRHGLIEEQTHEELAAVLGVNVRRSKYLKLKLLQRAASDPLLQALAAEVLR
jgi:RNA polymerase sigma-70 factor (ECF subfamily)